MDECKLAKARVFWILSILKTHQTVLPNSIWSPNHDLCRTFLTEREQVSLKKWQTQGAE